MRREAALKSPFDDREGEKPFLRNGLQLIILLMWDGGGDRAPLRIVQFDLDELSGRSDGPDDYRQRMIRRFTGQTDFMRACVIVLPVDFQCVDEAEKIADERRDGMVVEGVRRTGLLNLAVVDKHNPIRDVEGLLLVVGDENRRDAEVVVSVAKPTAEFETDFCVQSSKWFVEKKIFRIDGENACEGDALPLPAGKLRRKAFGDPVELDEIEQEIDFFADLLFRRAFRTRFRAEAEGDVLEDGKMAEEGVMLEDETDAAGGRRDVPCGHAVADDVSAVGCFESGDDAKERRFAAAGRAEQGDEFAVIDVERDAVEDARARVGFMDVFDLNAHVGCCWEGRAPARPPCDRAAFFTVALERAPPVFVSVCR